VSILELIGIALGLGMDAFAVALGAGATGRSSGARAAFRLSFHFGLFQFFMPVAGWFGGSLLVSRIAPYDHWLAFGLLTVIGGRMIRAGLHAEPDADPRDPSRGWSLVLLSLATSIDALAVGLSLALLGQRIWYPSGLIGVVAAAMTLTGLRLGHRLGLRFGRRMEIAGGVILIAIGIKIVVEHLT
jgi:putative Mn2+ efflux pump MntP